MNNVTGDIKEKKAGATKDYKFDFKPLTHGVSGAVSDYLDSDETISTTFTVTAPTGLTVVSSARTDTNTSITAWISGGTVREEPVKVTCTVKTSKDRIEVIDLYLIII